MFEETNNGFIKTSKAVKVKKPGYALKGYLTKEDRDSFKDEIEALINNGKTIVRKNHVTKKTFEILTLDIDVKLEKSLYIAISMEMKERYNSNFLPKYGGWIIKELPYEPDRQKSMKEMQEEFLAKNQAKKIADSEINYLSKDLQIYKSKSYINTESDYKKAIATMVHIYDNLRFMTPDGSMDVIFGFKRLVAESKQANAFQTIYYMVQTSNKTDKTKKSSINEINIPKFLEDFKMVKYDYDVCNEYFKNYNRNKYGSRSGKTINVNGNRYTVDDTWNYDD